MASSWIMSLKVAFISAGILSTALILNLSFPAVLEFLNCEIPHLWSIVLTWLKPPYLYLVLNCIILTIVVASKLQPPKSETDGFAVVSPLPIQISKVPEDLSFADLPPIKAAFEDVPVGSPVVFGYLDEAVEEVLEARPDEETAEAVVGIGEGVTAVEEVVISASETEKDEFVVSRSDCLPPRYPVEYSAEKPLVSRRFGYRESDKASPEGGKTLLGVSKPKRQDTLESTWRMITEGRPMPLTRHLKKSETWDTQGRGARNGDSPSASPAPLMNKSETFHDRATSNDSSLSRSPGGRLKREPSPSQDELNRRVEAFIRKFNEEMRLQRQESLKQYSEMAVGGGGPLESYQS